MRRWRGVSGIRARRPRQAVHPRREEIDYLFDLLRRQLLRKAGHGVILLPFAVQNNVAHVSAALAAHDFMDLRAEHATGSLWAVTAAAIDFAMHESQIGELAGISDILGRLGRAAQQCDNRQKKCDKKE